MTIDQLNKLNEALECQKKVHSLIQEAGLRNSKVEEQSFNLMQNIESMTF